MKFLPSNPTTIFIIVCASLLPETVFAKLLVKEGELHLRSTEIKDDSNNPLPEDETHDVIWLFNHSISLQLHEFHLNGHLGDFVLISEYPLVNADVWKSRSGQDDYNLVELADSIITEQGFLLSWMVQHKKFEAINEEGTFVLFHSEAKDPTGTAIFDGFDIEVQNYDHLVSPPPSTTEDPYIPPKPGQESNYISRFLVGKNPLDFFNELPNFKEQIAKLTTDYCGEKGLDLDGRNISSAEVNIPGPNAGREYAGVHYCDPTWPEYHKCVEVTFAIDRVDAEGYYLLPATRLAEMWAEKAGFLQGYDPFYPEEKAVDLNTLVFIAFFCGIILSLFLLLAMAWVKRNSRVLLDYKNAAAAAGNKSTEVDDDRPQLKHYDDRENPMNRFILRREMSPASDYLRANEKKRSASHFESVPTEVHAFDNSGFEMDQEENDGAPPFKRNDAVLNRKANRRPTGLGWDFAEDAEA